MMNIIDKKQNKMFDKQLLMQTGNSEMVLKLDFNTY